MGVVMKNFFGMVVVVQELAEGGRCGLPGAATHLGEDACESRSSADLFPSPFPNLQFSI